MAGPEQLRQSGLPNFPIPKEKGKIEVNAASLVESKRGTPIITKKGYAVYFDAIVLMGVPGTGKTAVGKRVARALGLKYFKPSTKHREIHRKTTGEEIIGAHKRDPKVDYSVDDVTKALILERKGNIIEGHRAGIIAYQVNPFTTLRVMLDVEKPSTSHVRVRDRENQRIDMENIQRIRDGLKPLGKLTVANIRKETQQRQDDNREFWKELYPNDPDAYDVYNGVTNVYVDTEHMGVNEVVGCFISFLEHDGWARKLSSDELRILQPKKTPTIPIEKAKQLRFPELF